MSRDTAPPAAEEAADDITARVRQNWRITYPLIVASLTPVVLALADTAILGHYSTEALATISLALQSTCSPPR